MTTALFAIGVFVIIGVLFLALFTVAIAAPASPALWALTGAAFMCLVIMLLFFLAAASTN